MIKELRGGYTALAGAWLKESVAGGKNSRGGGGGNQARAGHVAGGAVLRLSRGKTGFGVDCMRKNDQPFVMY